MIKLALSLVLLTLVNISHAKFEKDFFSQPSPIDVQLSPSGNIFAALSNNKQSSTLHLKRLSPTPLSADLNLHNMADIEGVAHQFQWIDERHIGISYSESILGLENRLDTKKRYTTLVIEIDAQLNGIHTKKVRTPGYMLDGLPNEPGKFLYGKQGYGSSIYKLDISRLDNHKKKLGKLDKVDGGQFSSANRILSIPGGVVTWFLGEDSQHYALFFDRQLTLKLVELNKQEITSTLYEWPNEPRKDKKSNEPLLIPISYSGKGQRFYCIDINQKQLQKLYIKDYQTGDQSVIHQTQGQKIVGLKTSTTGELIGALVIKHARIEIEYIDTQTRPTTQEIAHLIQTTVGGAALSIKSDFNLAPSFYISSLDSNEPIKIFGPEGLTETIVAGTQYQGTVKTEELDIHYLLNKPPINQAYQHPLIVMPHGGPIGIFDTPYYDATTQYLVANGYAVLRVNFRGSGGYSEEFQQAGKGNWSTGMIKDIHAATSVVLKDKSIDERRICSYGASYGGYAATLLAIDYPQTYKCVVSLAGLSDLYLLATDTSVSAKTKTWIHDQLSIEAPRKLYPWNLDTLKERSTPYLASEIRSPVLIQHGSEDDIVDVEHAHRLYYALKSIDKPVTLKIYEGQNHHFNNTDSIVSIMKDALLFIDQHLGDPL